jgi:hypothetical protein
LSAFANGEVVDMGWNAECGASMGFTIELLSTYYQLDYSISATDTGFSITCGVLGMSHIFDAVISGASEAEAVAKFVRGIALNAHRFAHEPEELCLSPAASAPIRCLSPASPAGCILGPVCPARRAACDIGCPTSSDSGSSLTGGIKKNRTPGTRKGVTG